MSGMKRGIEQPTATMGVAVSEGSYVVWTVFEMNSDAWERKGIPNVCRRRWKVLADGKDLRACERQADNT